MLRAERNVIIQELRHQLYYSNPVPERDAVRRQLKYWIYHSRNHTHSPDGDGRRG